MCPVQQPSWAYSALSGLAGGVLLAKTATGELAWGDTWFDNITTRNPWNIDTGSCGSSAGSAAAVAAGRRALRTDTPGHYAGGQHQPGTCWMRAAAHPSKACRQTDRGLYLKQVLCSDVCWLL